MRVLVANAGSSSLKLSLLDADDSELWSKELPAPRAVVDGGAVAEALAELPATPDVEPSYGMRPPPSTARPTYR